LLLQARKAEILIDRRAWGEICSETGEKGLFDQSDDGFACVRSRGTPHGDHPGVSGATSLPIKGAKTVKIARPRHNSGHKGVG